VIDRRIDRARALGAVRTIDRAAYEREAVAGALACMTSRAAPRRQIDGECRCRAPDDHAWITRERANDQQVCPFVEPEVGELEDHGNAGIPKRSAARDSTA
jgi:hypothetical protein